MSHAMFALALSTVLVCSARASEVQLSELFEVETTQVEQLVGIGLALDPQAIMRLEPRPSSAELAVFLNKARRAGVPINPPDWFNDQEHLVPVRVSAQLPAGGAGAGELLDCQVTSLDDRGIKGLMLLSVHLQDSAGGGPENMAVARGVVEDAGQVAGGARLEQDCSESIATDEANEWITFRLKEDHGLAANLAMLTDAADRIREHYSGYYSSTKSDAVPIAEVHGTRRLRVRIPSAYTSQVELFVSEINEKKLAALDAEGQNQSATDPYSQARERIEQAYRDRLQSILSYIPGVRVAVSAEMMRVEDSTAESYKPRALYASIAVPRDYVFAVIQQKNPEVDFAQVIDTDYLAVESDVKLNVERIVQNILPHLSLGEDEYKQVSVTFYHDVQEATKPTPTSKSTGEQVHQIDPDELEPRLRTLLDGKPEFELSVDFVPKSQPSDKDSIEVAVHVELTIPRSYSRKQAHLAAFEAGKNSAEWADVVAIESRLKQEHQKLIEDALAECGYQGPDVSQVEIIYDDFQ
ncbi:hypothetical protein [Aeoliella sp.]|uniref:hypothetical protein n=1 Tax=Aeoliella sp. TaxID=2795800 RepID=UPI003CCBE674